MFCFSFPVLVGILLDRNCQVREPLQCFHWASLHTGLYNMIYLLYHPGGARKDKLVDTRRHKDFLEDYILYNIHYIIIPLAVPMPEPELAAGAGVVIKKEGVQMTGSHGGGWGVQPSPPSQTQPQENWRASCN